jgi:hypothetical protein
MYASTATMRAMIVINATTSVVVSGFAIREFWRQSSGGVDLDHVRGNGVITDSGTGAISIPANRPRSGPTLAYARRQHGLAAGAEAASGSVIYDPTRLVVMALRNASGEVTVEIVSVPSPTP